MPYRNNSRSVSWRPQNLTLGGGGGPPGSKPVSGGNWGGLSMPAPQPPARPPAGMLPIGAPGSDMQTFGTGDIPGYMPGMGYSAIKNYYDYLNQQRAHARQEAGFEGDYGGWSMPTYEDMGKSGYNPQWSPGTIGGGGGDDIGGGGGGAGGGGGEEAPPSETPQGKPIDIPADPPLEGGLETPQGTPITYFARAASGGQRQPYAMQQQQFPRKRRGFGGYPGGGVYGGGYGGGGYGGTYGIQQSS